MRWMSTHLSHLCDKSLTFQPTCYAYIGCKQIVNEQFVCERIKIARLIWKQSIYSYLYCNQIILIKLIAINNNIILNQMIYRTETGSYYNLRRFKDDNYLSHKNWYQYHYIYLHYFTSVLLRTHNRVVIIIWILLVFW